MPRSFHKTNGRAGMCSKPWGREIKKWKLSPLSLTSPLDDMSSRIDDLEKNIADLMTQAGVEELDGENKIPATQKSWRLLVFAGIWNTFLQAQRRQMAFSTNYYV